MYDLNSGSSLILSRLEHVAPLSELLSRYHDVTRERQRRRVNASRNNQRMSAHDGMDGIEQKVDANEDSLAEELLGVIAVLNFKPYFKL